jgi:hypothetical protein
MKNRMASVMHAPRVKIFGRGACGFGWMGECVNLADAFWRYEQVDGACRVMSESKPAGSGLFHSIITESAVMVVRIEGSHFLARGREPAGTSLGRAQSACLAKRLPKRIG